MKQIENSSFIQFIKFCIVGIFNTLISLAVYYIFLCINSQLYLLGNVAGWIVSVFNSFFWNNKYVFQSKSSNMADLLRKLGKTYLSYGATLLLSSVLLYVEVELFQWSAMICPILNLLVTIPLNFLLNKYWALRK